LKGKVGIVCSVHNIRFSIGSLQQKEAQATTLTDTKALVRLIPNKRAPTP